uniref:Fibronectin type-II domain-containing protein n=1 Tax=Equus caballus TaxID=9796 RepID=A0A3Q2HEG1_HORSE
MSLEVKEPFLVPEGRDHFTLTLTSLMLSKGLSTWQALGDDELLMATTSLLFAENKCVFPFNYRADRYYDCTKADSFYHWCSLTEDYRGSWKYCAATDYAKCVFPFVYRGLTYESCTTDGSLFRISWCSVTPNYDHHGAWKYC